jgi:hypothetical protein
VTAGDSRKIYMPGRRGEAPTIADADNDALIKAEKQGRERMLAGKWDEKFYDANLRQLLTMRKEMRFRKLHVEPCPELDGGAPPAQPPREPEAPRGAAPAQGNGRRPPSDRGANTGSRTAAADQVWESDSRGEEREDDGSVPPEDEPPL